MSNTNPIAKYLAIVHLRYVIKKHHATRLHYDVRFEYLSPRGKLELASFVIVEGPSLDPTCNRRAIRVSDHNVRYMESERVIPPGRYGAGPMLVWDRGAYTASSGITGQRVDFGTALHEGIVVIELNGEKLNGHFELRFVRKYYLEAMKCYQEEWSFVKLQDDKAVAGSNIVDEQPNSVLSYRSLEEIAAGVSMPKKCDNLTGTLIDPGDWDCAAPGT
jgi:bifunctional non-homologous end joining protein LigD